PVIYVTGNHEFYGGVIEDDMRHARTVAAQYQVHFLENNEVTIGSTRFLGCTLWTDFALWGTQEMSRFQVRSGMNDFHQIADRRAMDGGSFMPERFTTSHALRRHRESRAWLEAHLARPHDGPTVVVTHHAPHRNSV